MKPTVIDPKTTTRAAAFDLWMNAPNPMVTFFKTLDVTPLVGFSRKRGLKFNMLLCWCIGKAASEIKEFYLLPVGPEATMAFDFKNGGTDMNELRARVISQGKGIYKIQSGTAVKLAEISGKYRYETQTVSDYPAVGDYVIAMWSEDDSNAVITGLFPRKSCFIRKAAGARKQEQVVAANIDTAFICMSLNNNFNIRRLERYLSVAYESGAAPVVVLTKSDLCSDVENKILEAQNVAPGVDVLAISSLDEDYEAVVNYILPGKTVAFIGSSGVGKSTLINKLTGTDSIATREIGNDDKGRHTTTHWELLQLPNGAFVIDTPGMRELGMWDSGDGIDTAFADIEELSRMCRYADCTHTSEPGCAVVRALADGTLDAARLASYRKLKTENDYAADNSRYLEAKRTKFKEIAKINKSNRKR